MGSPTIEAMLASRRSFAVAAAGCGKTELLGQLVADARSGRQLVLTHTHAGVAAIKKRLASLRVPDGKFHLETIAGWSLRYGAAYPNVSGFASQACAIPDWNAAYPGAERICKTALGRRIVAESYAGVLIDEYQDCSVRQHRIVQALAESVPCRGVGDPLQTIFGFREDPVVSWEAIKADFDVIEGALTEPWRWRRQSCNEALGEWLEAARTQLERSGQVFIEETAPVSWIQHEANSQHSEVWSSACRGFGMDDDESFIAILKWPTSCKELARRMGGRWPVIERFDDLDLPALGTRLVSADGATLVKELVRFVADRMTGIGAALQTAVDAIASGRGVSRIKNHRLHAERLAALAMTPTPENALAWLEGILGHHDDWWLYRRECVYQLREALRHCEGASLAQLPNMIAAARTRARHRGRRAYRRTIGTPLLIKGLEFDHAVLLWEPNHLSREELYVALTRASKSLTIVSQSRTLVPRAN